MAVFERWPRQHLPSDARERCLSLATRRLGAASLRPRRLAALATAVVALATLASTAEAQDAAVAAASARSRRLLASELHAEVRSAGFFSGNSAEFILDGKPLNVKVGRGMNVAVLGPEGSLESFGTFDTYADGAPALVKFLADIPNGRVVLVAAKDDASHQLGGAGAGALETCGAAKIYSLGYQASYALVGVKGGTALAEVRRAAHGGPAVASARFQPDDVGKDRRPVCDPSSSMPPVVGSLSNGQLELNAGCRYRLFESANVATCLENSWFVVAGGSNSMLMTMQLANMLAPDAVLPSKDNFTVGGYTLLDLIVKDGAVLYKKIHNFTACTQVGYPAFCQKGLAAMIADAPAPSGGVRITQLLSEFWDHVDVALDLVEKDTVWKDVDVAFIGQSIDWYLYCSAWKLPYCYRKWMMDKKLTRQQATGIFRGDLERTMGRLRTFCAPGGRAGVHGCVIPTGAFTQTDASAFQQQVKLYYYDYNNAIRDVVLNEDKPYLRLLDTWNMGQTMWEEFDHGHGSPIVQLWSIQIIMNGMCKPEQAAKATFAKFEGPSCHLYDVKLGGPSSTCPVYRDTCTIRCKTWECMNAVPCKITAVQPVHLDLRGACEADVRVAFPAGQNASGGFGGHYVGPSSNAIGVGPVAQGITTGIGIFLALVLAAAAYLWTRWQELRLGGYSEESGSETESDEEGSVVTGGQGTPICSSDEEGKSRVIAAAATPVRPAVAGDRMPLGLARFLASMHVVLGHLNAKGVVHPSCYFYGWGFTWVPWFFMLSGFVLYTAHARRPKPESALEYVVRRAGNVYPLYAASLLPAFFLAWIHNAQPSVTVLVAQTWLTQAWNPMWTEEALQTQCWFLSCMVVYWFFFGRFARCVESLSLRGTLGTMLVLFAVPWLIILIPALTDQSMTWYKAHSWGESGTWVDVAVVALKFNPVCYAHVFIVGMLLARLRLLLDAQAVKEVSPSSSGDRSCPLFFEFMTPIGYLGILVLFLVPALQPWAAKLSLRLSILMPLQAAIVLGLGGLPSFEQPRIAAFASHFNFLESYSYACYVFQFVCYSLWPETDSVCLPLFYVFLWSTAFLAVNLIQRPAQAWWEQHTLGRWAVPIALSCLWIGMSFAPPYAVDPYEELPPRTVELQPLGPHPAASDLLDVRLEISDASGAANRVLINPSLALVGDRVVLAARRHGFAAFRGSGEHAGQAATIIDHTWYSQILLGEAAVDDAAWGAWPRTGVSPFRAALTPWTGLRGPTGGPWAHLCAREHWIPSNGTLIRHVVTGPEDPKVIALPDGATAVAFNSLPPLGADTCGNRGAVSQMYLAPAVNPAAAAAPNAAARLQCGHQEDPEKNWIPFVYGDKLHFVYSVVPHAVALAGDDGSCNVQRSTTFAPLRRLQQQGLRIRGSGQAVLVDDATATPNLPRKHYMALLHVVDPVAKTYANFAYRFGPEPPFPILQVSAQLPLTPLRAAEHSKVHGQAPFAFASSLVLRNGTVAIAYGAGDRDARALVLSLERLDGFFACGGAEEIFVA